MPKKLYTITNVLTKTTVAGAFFDNKPEAKRARDALNDELPNNQIGFVVSPGPDHHKHARKS